MIHFNMIDNQTFLNEYWQKKPLVIRQALPGFVNPLSADELAGLSLEDEVESRLVIETPNKSPHWQLKRGPFVEADFKTLPKTHWTLLVQGVDRLLPDVAALFEHFNFIPAWRLDDVMISYAVKQGGVGPHYDHYDVFLYQAQGRRRWSLTRQDCHVSNCLNEVELRIMERFVTEEEYVLEAGDMLYLPPHVGHHGVSLSDDCMTYSFGYRSYQGQELWDSFGDYLSEHRQLTTYYQDPAWNAEQPSSMIPPQAWLQAKHLLEQVLVNEQCMKTWFGCFVTSLDAGVESQLPFTCEENATDLAIFLDELKHCDGFQRDILCRFAYSEAPLQLFINGCEWDVHAVTPELVRYLANHSFLNKAHLHRFLMLDANQHFLYELWKKHFIVCHQTLF